MIKPGRPLEGRGNLELDLVEAKGKDIGKFLHHPVKDFYFITLIDRLTGWFEVGRALHKDALTISKKIRQLLKRMARALKIDASKFYIRSDSGSEFKAETQAVFKELKLRHKFVKSGNRIEKVNQDFQRTWYRLMRLGRGDLEELDQQAAAITNNLLSKITGKTPLEALDIEDSKLSAEFNKRRAQAIKYKAPEIKVGDKVEVVIEEIEDGEGHQECLKRELKEELNINAEIGELYSEYVYKYPHISYQLYFYGVNNYTGEFKYNAHDRLEWATPDQFDQYNFLPGDEPLLDTIKDSYA